MRDDLKAKTIRIQTHLKERVNPLLVVDGGYGDATADALEIALGIGKVGNGVAPVVPIPGGATAAANIATKPLAIVTRLLPDTCYSGRPLVKPTGVCIHYVSAIYSAPGKWADVDTILKQTRDLNLPGDKRGEVLPAEAGGARSYASYHFLIGREGDVSKLTPLDRQAYHAGESTWAGRSNCNEWSIGVALVAYGDVKGRPDSGYTEAQYTALIELIKMLKNDYKLEHIFGHDECAPGRKKDPGGLFQWRRVR